MIVNSISPKLVLIRGLPGSGKSTIAKSMAGYKHYEADMYHMVDGEYVFDFNNIKKAHEWCQSSTLAELEKGGRVVVSNTFTEKWEILPYIEFGYSYSVIVARGEFENTHKVPEDVLIKMKARFIDQ